MDVALANAANATSKGPIVTGSHVTGSDCPEGANDSIHQVGDGSVNTNNSNDDNDNDSAPVEENVPFDPHAQQLVNPIAIGVVVHDAIRQADLFQSVPHEDDHDDDNKERVRMVDADQKHDLPTTTTALIVRPSSGRKRKTQQPEPFFVASTSDRTHRKAFSSRAAGSPLSSRNKKSKTDSNRSELESSWICAECKEAECIMNTPQADQLLLCDGSCRRLFHYPCAGLDAFPDEQVPYLCQDCINQRHACSICQQYGNDEEDVFLCSKETCGLYFHEACLAMQNIEIGMIPETRFTTVAVPSTSKTITAAVAVAGVRQDIMHVTTCSEMTKGEGEEQSSQKEDMQQDEHQHLEGDESSHSLRIVSPAPIRRRFICPSHWCWTCTQKDLEKQEQDALASQGEELGVLASRSKIFVNQKKKKRKPKGLIQATAFQAKSERFRIRCMECPISYHVSCIPPTARFHELALLCHEHAATCKLPYLDPELSLQSQIERAIENKYGESAKKMKRRFHPKGTNKFFPGIVGSKMTRLELNYFDRMQSLGGSSDGESADEDNACYGFGFCLPCDVKDEVYSKPPTYRHVYSLQYVPGKRPTRILTSGETCHCVGFCGEECINRVLYIECVGGASQKSNSSSSSNKYSNCRVGVGCGNRQISKRKVAKCKIKREKGKGWGLVVVDKVMKGDLVQEYVGEVIDSKTMELRLTDWSNDHPNDPNFYIMSLSPGWYVDARSIGNLSRFINHSCEPNCIVLQINVGGFLRCGLFAMRDIVPGEFLSYDYHFDTRHREKFSCRCGSALCRGTMKPGQTATEDEAAVAATTKKDKSVIWEKAKTQFERDKKFMVEYYENEAKRRSQVRATVPGTDNFDELVSNGVQARYRPDAIQGRLFLWRNAMVGSNFAQRLGRMDRLPRGNNNTC